MFKNYKITGKNENIFARWDIDEDGIVRNEKPKSIKEVYDHIVNKFKEKYPNAWDKLDYFDTECDSRYRHKVFFPIDYHYLSIFYVTGSNEGYYFHIEIIKSEKRELIFLGKTLSEDIEDAIEINNAFQRILKP